MSRNKAILYAFAAPLLNLMLQMAVLMCISTYNVFWNILTHADMSYADILQLTLDDTMSLVLSNSTLIVLLAGGAFIGIMLLAYRKRRPGLWESVQLNRDVTVQMLGLAALAGLGYNLVSSGLLTGLPIPDEMMSEYEELMDTLLAGNPVFSILAAGLLIPFIEELVFRGFTQRFLETAVGPWMAVIMQALLFGWFHGNPLQAAYTIFAGLLMGIFYMWTRNLWASVVFHVAYNLSGFVIDGILRLVFGDGEIVLTSAILAVLVASGMTLIIFCLRQLYLVRKKPPKYPQCP